MSIKDYEIKNYNKWIIIHCKVSYDKDKATVNHQTIMHIAYQCGKRYKNCQALIYLSTWQL